MKEALNEFTKYTNPYKQYGEMIDLKIKHTKRVTDLCVEIAKSLKLSKEGEDIAYLCGLLHDIGRFEQWKNYETFSDMKSIDHGDLGYKILKEKDYISVYTENEKYKKIILKAVKYHNKFALPKNLTKEERLFAKLIRDADKIDILKLAVEDAFHMPPDDTKISDKVWEHLQRKESILRENVKTRADRLAVFLAFPFDINYSYSFQVLKEKNYMNLCMDRLEEEASEEFKKQIEYLRPIMNQYIEERCTC